MLYVYLCFVGKKRYFCPHPTFTVALVVKNLLAKAGDVRDASLIPGSGRPPGKGNGNPTPVFFPGESCGHRNVAGYGS